MDDNQNILESLRRLEPGKLPYEVFNEIARLTVTPVVELVVVVGEKVLLTKRPEEDTYWPRKYALPGKIIASGEYDSIEEYVENLETQIGIDAHASYCGNWLLTTRRGVEVAFAYRVDTDELMCSHKQVLVNRKDLGRYDIIPEHRTILDSCL